KLYKHTFSQPLYLKQSISHVEIDKQEMYEWLQQAFMDIGETEHTKNVYETIDQCLKKSTTMVDFFAQLLFKLFPDEGIVLIDSGHESIRSLESDWFIQMIEKQPAISEAIYQTVQKLQQKGYEVNVDVEQHDAHLFYHDENNERILLKREAELFVGKNDEVSLTEEELIEIAKNHPNRLSNNVFTRQMMKELLFPTLAFFGGDGEISYWAVLKSAFRALDDGLQVPPVIPRLSLTYVTKRLEKLVDTRVLAMDQIVNNGIEQEKMNWLLSQSHPPIDTLFQEVHKQMNDIHRPLRALAKEISADLDNEAQKNFEYIQKNITYLEQRIERKLTEKYDLQLAQFEEIARMLKPKGLLQERVWNPLPFLNEYGL